MQELGHIVSELILLAVVWLLFRQRDRDMLFTQAVVERSLALKQIMSLEAPIPRVAPLDPIEREAGEDDQEEQVRMWKREAAEWDKRQKETQERFREAMIEAQNEQLAREAMRPSAGQPIPSEESPSNDN